jgi:hypothetical protein
MRGTVGRGDGPAHAAQAGEQKPHLAGFPNLQLLKSEQKFNSLNMHAGSDNFPRWK